MKDLEISVAPGRDLWMFRTGLGDNITLLAEDDTDFVKMELTREQAEQICEWLKEYLNK